MARGSCGTVQPSTPSSINSRVAAAGPPITGLPQDQASTSTAPKLSRDEGTQSTVQARSSESRIAGSTCPR